jgi:hypothetical protein
VPSPAASLREPLSAIEAGTLMNKRLDRLFEGRQAPG